MSRGFNRGAYATTRAKRDGLARMLRKMEAIQEVTPAVLAAYEKGLQTLLDLDMILSKEKQAARAEAAQRDPAPPPGT